MGLKSKLEGDVCVKCGDLLIARPDKLPLCSKCSKKMTEFYAKVRPDKCNDKTYLRGSPITEQSEWE